MMFGRAVLFGSCLAISLMACRTTSTTRDDTTPNRLTLNPNRADPEECKRRATEMARQEEDMRSSPQDVVDTAKPPATVNNWDSANNPCKETLAGDPAEDRLIVQTQVRSAMQAGDYDRARQLLPKLYTSPMSRDDALQKLTREVVSAHTPAQVAAHRASDSILMREGLPVCVATRQAHALHDDYDTLSDLVKSPQIHIYCGVPNSNAQMNTQVRVRYRVGTGRYEELVRKDLGALADLTVDQGIHITMDIPAEFITKHEQAYMEVSLMGLTSGQTPTPLSKGSFFWFKTSD